MINFKAINLDRSKRAALLNNNLPTRAPYIFHTSCLQKLIIKAMADDQLFLQPSAKTNSNPKSHAIVWSEIAYIFIATDTCTRLSSIKPKALKDFESIQKSWKWTEGNEGKRRKVR